MKKITSILIALFVLSGLCLAQTTTTTTTLAAALSATSTTVRLTAATSVSGFTNGQPQTWLFIDREFMPVYSISGTTATVQRNGGGMSGAHASGAKVWVGPYNAFLQAAPAGPCTATSIAYLPMVNVATGDIWNCTNSKWGTLNLYSTRITMGTLITAAGTIAPTANWHHISGATTVTTITPPAALPTDGGCITFIPDMVGYFSGGNIALSITTVVDKALTMCYDGSRTTPKWVGSY